jgi:hypothetical protein
MNKPRIWRGVWIAVLGIGITAAIATGAYQAGLASGLASSGHALVEQPGAGTLAWSHGGHGFFFAPFFFLLILLLLAKVLFWRRSWRCGQLISARRRS